MYWKNSLINGLVALFKRRKKIYPSSRRNFLIVSTTGLGDTLWGTPAIRALKETFQESSITLLTSPIGLQVLQNNPHINQLLILKSPLLLSLLSLIPKLWKGQFDTIFLFHTSQRLIPPLCALLNPHQLIATRGMQKGLDPLLTHPIDWASEHEIERRLKQVQFAGATLPFSSPYKMEMGVSKIAEEEANEWLRKHNIAPGTLSIALHPGARNRFKQWEPRCFIELGNRLKKTFSCQIFITGDANERPLAETIAAQIEGAIPLAGEISLAGLAALLKEVSLFITNDTGPMHLAFAMETPTISLFGPTNPALCGPLKIANAHVLATQKTCKPCLYKKCLAPFCLLQIGVDTVYDKATAILS